MLLPPACTNRTPHNDVPCLIVRCMPVPAFALHWDHPHLHVEVADCVDTCRREILAPLQQAEAIDIRRKSDSFGEKVEDFRKFFQQKAPFSVPGAELKLEHVRLR